VVAGRLDAGRLDATSGDDERAIQGAWMGCVRGDVRRNARIPEAPGDSGDSGAPDPKLTFMAEAESDLYPISDVYRNIKANAWRPRYFTIQISGSVHTELHAALVAGIQDAQKNLVLGTLERGLRATINAEAAAGHGVG
jgi:hypothetical protein